MLAMRALVQAVDVFRNFNRGILNRFAVFLNTISRGRITANSITFTSLIAHFPIAYLIAIHSNYWAGGLLFFFGLLDAVDGSVARLQGQSTSKGMLLDSITDKIKEVVLYIGVAYVFVDGGQAYWAVWAVAACGVSLLVSYVNAWGEAMVAKRKLSGHQTNKTFRSGLMTYDVRMTVFWVGLLTNHLYVSVAFIAVVSLGTALGRAKSIMQSL